MSEAAKKTEELEALVGTTMAGRYRLDALIGIGGMGAVFRAHHLLLKRDVAIKVLHPELTSNEDISRRFDREAQSAARLDHPNIIPVTEFGSTEDGMKYMVMQLLAGKELGTLMGRPLEPLRAMELEVQILRGLEHAHGNGVIHRDLKPENVFVTEDHEGEEVLKLVDFGIAKIVDESDEDSERAQPLTRLGLVFGTPHYMSPEQATGSEIDHRTDIYSAGVLLYQMLAGKLPFDHDDPVSLIRMQVTVDPPPLPEGVPVPLVRVVNMMMAKQRDRRYPDARSARKALQAVQAKLAEQAGVPVPSSTLDTGIVDPREIYGPQGVPGSQAGSDAPGREDTAGAPTVSLPGAPTGPLGSGPSGPMAGGPPGATAGPTTGLPTGPTTGLPTGLPSLPPATPSGGMPLPGVPAGAEASSSGPMAQGAGPGPTGPHPTSYPQSPTMAPLATGRHASVAGRSLIAAVPRRWWYVGGAFLALLILIAAWPSSRKDSESASEEPSSEVVVADSREAEPSGDGEGEVVVIEDGVDEPTLVAIDRALTSNNDSEALNLIRPARDKFPQDPQLLWREGKALAMRRAKSSKVTALERYGEALDQDPALLDDPDFYSQLFALLRTDSLRAQAIDLALQKLGTRGHKFLLELVNVDDPRRMLGWVDRHRVLGALRSSPDSARLVDWKLNLARDLYQVEEAPQPCVAFRQTLERIAEFDDPYFLQHLNNKRLKVPSFRGDGKQDAQACAELEAKLGEVRSQIAATHPDEAG